jgi:hypothetical protein
VASYVLAKFIVETVFLTKIICELKLTRAWKVCAAGVKPASSRAR